MRKPSADGPRRNVTIRMSDDELAWLNETAKKQFRTVAGLVRFIISQYQRGILIEKRTGGGENGGENDGG